MFDVARSVHKAILHPPFFILIFLLCFLPALTRAETVVQAWVQRYNGPGNDWDQALAVAVDASNNVIVTGYATGSGGWSSHYATIKYSSAGVPLWTNLYNGPGNGFDKAYAVAVDGSNNVIVTGESDGGASFLDYATIKYSDAGVPLWTNRYSKPGYDWDQALAVAVDSSNDVIVTGGSGGTNDYVTIKYSSLGAPLWTNRYDGPVKFFDQALAVAVDRSNHVIVTGYSHGSGVRCGYATIKYSSDGVPLWTNRYDGPGTGSGEAYAVAVDSSNNVIVTGHSAGSGTYPGYFDYATVKYSSDGVPLWTNRYNGPGNGDDEAYGLVVDGSNNVIVTGYSADGASRYDYATIQYSSDGVPLWTNHYNGPADGNDFARAVAVDANHNITVTGYSTNGTSFYDYAIIQYSSAGVPLWTNRYDGPAHFSDQACAVAADHAGNVYVTGYSSGSGSGYDYATIKYSILRPIPLEFQRVGNQLVLSWSNAAFRLQSAPLATGTFTNLPGATSPCTNPMTSGQQYYRLISN